MHLLAKLMVSSEEVAAAVISRQPSGEAGVWNGRTGPPTPGRHAGMPKPALWRLPSGRDCMAPTWLSILACFALSSAAAPMTGLLSRMSSLGPTGKAAHKLAQQMSRALGAGAGSAPGSPSAAGGGSQLARFNSLLSAAGSASAAHSAVNTPRAGADRPPLSRFASRGSGLAAAAVSAATSPTAAGATAGSAQLSAQPSFTTALLAQAAAEAGAASASAQLDAAAWMQHFQQAQQVRWFGLAGTHRSCSSASLPADSPCAVHPAFFLTFLHSSFPPPLLQGVADLQELLDLHRRYIRQASGRLWILHCAELFPAAPALCCLAARPEHHSLHCLLRF